MNGKKSVWRILQLPLPKICYCFSPKIVRFQNRSNKVAIELCVVQFWSEIILVISNRTHAKRSSDFEITRMISDQIALHSAQLPLFIDTFVACSCLVVTWNKVPLNAVNGGLDNITQASISVALSISVISLYIVWMCNFQHTPKSTQKIWQISRCSYEKLGWPTCSYSDLSNCYWDLGYMDVNSLWQSMSSGNGAWWINDGEA